MTIAPAWLRLADRGNRGADARVFGDVAGVVLRHVQIGADEHALAAHLPLGDQVGQADELLNGLHGTSG
jgi:hypothetical protein